MPTRQLLVTAALPYVNGHIHIGHLVEYIQADVWVRFQRLRGHRVAFVCADDTHGTATMIRARQEARSEQSIISEMNATHQQDFADFGVAFDHYGSTDSPSNRLLVNDFWKSLTAIPGVVHKQEVTQLYDPKAGCFLADRFVKGTCPNCSSPDQYGDSCDKCNTTYSPTELINPVSTLSGATPELRSATHLFVRLEPLRAAVESWIDRTPSPLQPEMANWLKGTFLAPDKPLRDWDVSRPEPYFGFAIPGETGQYFYVWVDAPVGYLASLTDAIAAGKVEGPLASWWPQGEAGAPHAEIHHFIGKDITYFHTVFWPAMLTAAGYRLPSRVHIHGFLTVDGEKMSKRKGTFIRARTYLEHVVEPAYLRYYFAAKLSRKVEDIDLNLGEFVEKVNSDLVGKVVNLASRSASFIAAAGLAPGIDAQWPEEGVNLLAAFLSAGEEIAALYDDCDYSEAMRRIMALADQANRYVERMAPWKLAKDPAQAPALRIACTIALNLFWRLAVLLAPVLPRLAEQAGELFGERIGRWDDLARLQQGKPIRPFKHLLARLQAAAVTAMVEASRGDGTPMAPGAPAAGAPAPGTTPPIPPAAAAGPGAGTDDGGPLAAEPLSPTVSFEDFAKLDLRIARVVSAAEVPGAKKILKLTVSLGGDERRTIFAGIKPAYPAASALVGRLIVLVANLAPRTMSFGVSEGMALAAGPGGADIFLLSADSGAKPGQRVH
jgi:methionyl-tRNA synthetase